MTKLTADDLNELELPAHMAKASGFKQVTIDVDHVLYLIAAARASLESRGDPFAGRPTFALVTENGWVHAVFNDEDRAIGQAAKRSVPSIEVDPLTGKHAYSVMRYAPSAPGAESMAGWVPKDGERVAYKPNQAELGTVTRVLRVAYVDWDEGHSGSHEVSVLVPLPSPPKVTP
jgi:hypothetical protein